MLCKFTIGEHDGSVLMSERSWGGGGAGAGQGGHDSVVHYKSNHFQMEKKTIKVTYSFGADANGAAHLKTGRLQLHIRTTLVSTITIEVTTGVDLSRS